METNNVHEQLNEVARLQGVTKGEAFRAPRWAFPVLGSASIGFFGFCIFAPTSVVGWGSIAWTAFIIGWVFAIRRYNRARPDGERTWKQFRVYLGVTTVLWAVVSLAVWQLGRPAWVVVGLTFALWGTGSGSLAAWRARHA